MTENTLEQGVSFVRSLFFLFLAYLFFKEKLPETSAYPLVAYGASLLFIQFLPFRSSVSSFFYSSVDTLFVGVLLYAIYNTESGTSLTTVIPIYALLAASLLPHPWRYRTRGFLFSFALLSFLFVSLALSRPYFAFISWDMFFYLLFLLCFSLALNFPLSLENRRIQSLLNEKQKEIDRWKEKVGNLKKDVKKETVRDSITNCFNEKYFLLKLKEEIPKAKRHNYSLAIAAVGIDYFRQYNQIYGVEKGDEAMRIIARLLLAYTRTSDLLSRLEKQDVFLTLLPFTNKEQAHIPLERFAEAVRRYRFDARDPKMSLSVSCGIAAFPEDSEKGEEIVKIALQAMKRAKNLGRNKILRHGE